MLDFYEFAKNFKEYLYSLGFVSLSTDGNTNYFYGKDYEEFFWVHSYPVSFSSRSVLWAVSISGKIILIIKFILLFEACLLPVEFSK